MWFLYDVIFVWCNFCVMKFLCDAIFVWCDCCVMRFLCDVIFVWCDFCVMRFLCDMMRGLWKGFLEGNVVAILINTLLAVHCNFLYFSQRKCRPWIREKLAAEMPVMRDRSWWFARRHLNFPIFLPPGMLPVGWQHHPAFMWRHIANPNKRYYEN